MSSFGRGPPVERDARPGLKLIQEKIRRLGKSQRELSELWGVDAGVTSKFFSSPTPFFPMRRAKILSDFAEIPLDEIGKLVPITEGLNFRRPGRPVGSTRERPTIPVEDDGFDWSPRRVEGALPKPKTIQFRTDQDTEGRAVATITIKADSDLDTIRLSLRLLEAAEALAAKDEDE